MKGGTIFMLLAFIVLPSIAYFWLPDTLSSQDAEESRSIIGIAVNADKGAKALHNPSLGWRPIQKKQLIYSDTGLFTEKNSKASFVLIDGTQIEQMPLTRIDLRGKDQTGDRSELEVDVHAGEAKLSLPKEHRVKKIMAKKSSVMPFPTRTQLYIKQTERDQRVSVYQGEVEMIERTGHSRFIKPGESAFKGPMERRYEAGRAQRENYVEEELVAEAMEELEQYRITSRSRPADAKLQGRDFRAFIQRLGSIHRLFLGEDAEKSEK